MNEHTFTVYSHISPNGKIYIGITGVKPENRWRNGAGYYENKHFASAIRKYGWNNFQHIILCKNVSADWAYKLEKYYIWLYKSNNPEYGYNNSFGGEKSSLGARYKVGEFTEEHKKALSNAWTRRKERGLGVPWNKGMKLKSTGKIDNFLEAGKKNAENRKTPVVQYNLQTGEEIKQFSSITEAAHYLGKSYTSSIIDVTLGKRKSAFGYGWRKL